MIRSLSRTYIGRNDAPTVSTVDVDIFLKRYFTRCMECTFCHDKCCTYGADIDAENVTRLEAVADALEAFVHVPRSEWSTGIIGDDPDYPGKRFTRTKASEGACVFLNRQGRGCMIHSFCLENGLDYHCLKPRVCWLFPVTFDAGLLRPSIEIQDGTLVCMNQGSTVYQAVRNEIRYVFGDRLIDELDQLEQEVLNPSNASAHEGK